MDFKKNKLTHLSDLGEFNLIKHLTDDVTHYHKSSVKGVGDDAAVMQYGPNYLVMTTDMLMEGIHFDLMYTPMKHLGYKAAVVNFSDVYAMNALPKQLVVSIAVSSKFSVEALDDFYAGLKQACEFYQVDLVGGDTSSSLTGLAICITAVGEVAPDKITYRSTAMENDLICVSGNLGAAYIGLQILEREKKIFQETGNGQPVLADYNYVLQRQLKPEARKDIAEYLNSVSLKPTSMIDVSDGLSSEILHICSQSEVGCKLFSDKIPVDNQTAETARELNMEPLVCALNGGEDYELLFTVPLENYDLVANRSDITIIGHIAHKSEGCNLVTEVGQQIPIVAQGWNAYGETK